MSMAETAFILNHFYNMFDINERVTKIENRTVIIDKATIGYDHPFPFLNGTVKYPGTFAPGTIWFVTDEDPAIIEESTEEGPTEGEESETVPEEGTEVKGTESESEIRATPIQNINIVAVSILEKSGYFCEPVNFLASGDNLLEASIENEKFWQSIENFLGDRPISLDLFGLIQLICSSISVIGSSIQVTLKAEDWKGSTEIPNTHEIEVEYTPHGYVPIDAEFILTSALASNAHIDTQKEYIKNFGMLSSGYAEVTRLGYILFRVWGKKPTSTFNVNLVRVK